MSGLSKSLDVVWLREAAQIPSWAELLTVVQFSPQWPFRRQQAKLKNMHEPHDKQLFAGYPCPAGVPLDVALFGDENPLPPRWCVVFRDPLSCQWSPPPRYSTGLHAAYAQKEHRRWCSVGAANVLLSTGRWAMGDHLALHIVYVRLPSLLPPSGVFLFSLLEKPQTL
ncbi:hypothetical protein LZ30DRAFT_80052 [Colletotrichum cereale]|nr:hypothetical protein LZ30DRAFT_80052 [Colletotrichum cereale]